MVPDKRVAAQAIGRQGSHFAAVDAWRMLDPTDPERMTPEERFREIAGLFARGVIRLRERRSSAAASPLRNRSETNGTSLEFPVGTSPDGQRG